MIVKDSSIWKDYSTVANELRGGIRIGLVIDRAKDKELDTTAYLVEILAEGKRYGLTCTQMVKFGSPFNYEQYAYTKVESLGVDLLPDIALDLGLRSGDVVVVAELSNAEGIILGALKHPARKGPVPADDIAYESRYNGLTTKIAKDGSYKITFNGEALPTQDIQLKLPRMTEALDDNAIYNPLTAGSYFTFEKDGSYEVSDAAKVLPQSLKIDKTGGKFTIKSGMATIEIDKLTQKVEVSCIDASISAKKSVKVNTTQMELEGLASVKIKGAKIAIGFGGIELIDTLIKTIDAIGLLVIPHHLGPCAPISASPTWAQIIALKVQLNLIKGSL